jgi:anthranilate synthase component 2
MRLLILDNYDSFTYNIVHAIRELGVTPDVIRNDRIALSDFEAYDKIIISPGPGIPSEAGILPDFLREYATCKPILGVCLGHQAIGERFGAKLLNLPQVYHGIQTPVNVIDRDYIFEGLPDRFNVGRYHSWVVDNHDLPDDLVVTANDDNGCIMALRHKDYDVRGVQFHPESILTPDGLQIFKNWLNH